MTTLAEYSQAGVFTAIFAVVGWIFVYINSRSLAKQGEVNSITASIEKMLQEVADENYKFWRDNSFNSAPPSEAGVEAAQQSPLSETAAKSRLFNAFVNFRCNFIEEKIEYLSRKCESVWHSNLDHGKFESSIIDLIAQIRDRSTFDSELPSLVEDKVSRVLEINHLSLELYAEIYNFLKLRYMAGQEKIPDFG
ncbi:hypothetical protein [Pseudomonas pergaminensis]|uniref:hypothetical protein n=1 Tax=Pseudomonas pergaminensis TaxID=2853159 RepID=UPI0034D6DD4F